jgi:hypothetical protein
MVAFGKNFEELTQLLREGGTYRLKILITNMSPKRSMTSPLRPSASEWTSRYAFVTSSSLSVTTKLVERDEIDQ